MALLTNSTLTGSLAAIDRLRESTPPQEAFSSGIAVWDRKEDLAELLRRSDLALYAAKDAGGGPHRGGAAAPRAAADAAVRGPTASATTTSSTSSPPGRQPCGS